MRARAPFAVLSVVAAAAAISVGLAVAPIHAQQPEPSKTLITGKGADLTMAKCAICHDITHVTRSRLTRDEWDDNIKVMIARGMPIEPHEIPVVLEYLATYYNRDKPPPAAEAAAPATSSEPAAVERVLAANGCTACHTLDKPLVGPAFREVAAKYRSQAGAAAQLARKVKEGGAGTWGAVPMPAHPQLSDDEALRLAAWVLQQ
jgi:cytochrome c551/c552